jgi:hypothetical protein
MCDPIYPAPPTTKMFISEPTQDMMSLQFEDGELRLDTDLVGSAQGGRAAPGFLPVALAPLGRLVAQPQLDLLWFQEEYLTHGLERV